MRKRARVVQELRKQEVNTTYEVRPNQSNETDVEEHDFLNDYDDDDDSECDDSEEVVSIRQCDNRRNSVKLDLDVQCSSPDRKNKQTCSDDSVLR